MVDTGIAGDIPDFQTPGWNGSRVIASAVTNPCASDATDEYGHGTHVAGLIAGNSMLYPSDSRYYGRYMGVAPRANLVSVKVSDDDGNTTVLDVINGIQFAVDNKAQYGIRVINLSLSSAAAESYRTDPLDAAVEQAWNAGIVVVAAAGNEALTADGVTFSPANDPWVITVGALDDRGTFTRLDDILAPWSSHGLTQDGVRKPEVLAPGGGLISALAPESDFAHLCPTCIVDTRYFKAGGTSMATGVVSGAAALLVEEHPTWTPAQVKGALMSTLDDVPGAGRRHRRVRRAQRQQHLVDEPRAEHDDRPEHRADRLGPRELPAGELPRCERLEPDRELEPGELPLRLRLHDERRRRSPAGELPKGQLPQDDGLRRLAR